MNTCFSFLKQYRDILLQIGSTIDVLDYRVTIQELLEISQKIAPSSAFHTGGCLFDFWVCFSLPPRQTSHILAQERKNGQISQQLQQETVQSHGAKFYMFVLKAIRDLKPSFTKQLYYISVLLHWKGLSNTGLELMAATNILLSEYQFRRLKSDHFSKQITAVKNILKNEPNVIWIDNYTKYFSKTFISLKRDTSSLISTTAVALTTMPKHLISLLDIPLKNITNSREMLGHDVFRYVMGKLRCMWNDWPSYYASSVATVYQITTIPPSAKTALDQLSEDIQRLESANGLANFHGIEVLDKEIGSNEGFAGTLDWLSENISDSRLTVCKVDQNIYWRYMRVGFGRIISFALDNSWCQQSNCNTEFQTCNVARLVASLENCCSSSLEALLWNTSCTSILGTISKQMGVSQTTTHHHTYILHILSICISIYSKAIVGCHSVVSEREIDLSFRSSQSSRFL